MKTDNPWKKLYSKTIYTNSWLTLREDKVIRPDGKEGIYSVVDTRIATGVLALTPQRDIYLVGQFRYPTNVYSWEIVEGGSDPGEDALETAKRELQEEAGLIAAKWTPLGSVIHLSNCISSEIGYFFIAEELTQTQARPDATELLQIKKVPFEECLAMADSGEINDAMSLIGIYRLDRRIRKGL